MLLNQRALSGIGNVLKSEVLFVSGIDPFAAVRAIDDDRLRKMLDVAVRLMRMNVGEASAVHASVAWTAHDREHGSGRPPLGLRTGRQAVPHLRHGYSVQEFRPRRPAHLLVPPVSDGCLTPI